MNRVPPENTKEIYGVFQVTDHLRRVHLLCPRSLHPAMTAALVKMQEDSCYQRPSDRYQRCMRHRNDVHCNSLGESAESVNGFRPVGQNQTFFHPERSATFHPLTICDGPLCRGRGPDTNPCIRLHIIDIIMNIDN